MSLTCVSTLCLYLLSLTCVSIRDGAARGSYRIAERANETEDTGEADATGTTDWKQWWFWSPSQLVKLSRLTLLSRQFVDINRPPGTKCCTVYLFIITIISLPGRYRGPNSGRRDKMPAADLVPPTGGQPYK